MERESDGLEPGESEVAAAEDLEEKREVNSLRRSFQEDFTMFLLNNILMSVQFFENYERDILNLRENCLDEQSIENQFKLLEADSLHKFVATRVTFQKKSDTKKGDLSVIHPLRSYITYKNVELKYTSPLVTDPAPKTSAYYRLTVQRCEDDKKEASGYVNLIDEDPSEDKFEVGLANRLINHPDNVSLLEGSSRNSGAYINKNDDFFCLEPERRSKPYSLSAYRTYEIISLSSFLPKICFKEIERRTGNVQLRQGKCRKIQKMLMSAAFKRHFAEVFISKLAVQLHFDVAHLESATCHYESINIQKNNCPHQVTPILQLEEWPPGATFFTDENGRKHSMEWPTKTMQETIMSLGCSLVPIGYDETSLEKSDYTLEWKIDFPKAEKYLMMHLMHSHVRCYLFALVIYKSFIETEFQSCHFGPRHMVNLLFLLVRKDFVSWPECRPGDSLIRFLTVLCNTLQKGCLRNFFLPKRNMYENSPLKIIHKAQTVLTRIIENPVPYFLKALENLKYKKDFYPEIDYLKLYNILTVKNVLYYVHKPSVEEEKLKGRKKRQVEMQLEEEVSKSIDVERTLKDVGKNLTVKIEVLRFFIKHFINVGYKSQEYQAYDQALLYLSHAKRMTTILSENAATSSEIFEFFERIDNATKRCRKQMGGTSIEKTVRFKAVNI